MNRPLVLPLTSIPPPRAQFQARRLLFIRLSGSLAVFAEVNFFFMPVILAQNESLREPPSGCGAFNPGFPGLAAL
jgi:hypothetical protein